MRRYRSIFLLSSLLLAAASARADEEWIEGPLRFYAGRQAERRVKPERVPRDRVLHWSLHALSATLAKGEQEIGEDLVLRIDVPSATRRIVAVLIIYRAGVGFREHIVEIVPSRAHETARLASGGRWGVVGPAEAVASLGFAAVPLESPEAIGRFQGKAFLIAPGGWKIHRFLPALLERVHDGARVLDLGADAGPWVAKEGSAPIAELVRARPLGPAAGNHIEPVAGLVRVAYHGKGCMVFSRYRIAEAIREDPLAEERLIELLDYALAAPPRLMPPRKIVYPAGSPEATLAELFEPSETGRVVVVWTPVKELVLEDLPRLEAEAASSVFRRAEDQVEGPGYEDLPGFLLFVTRLKIRVRAERPWR